MFAQAFSWYTNLPLTSFYAKQELYDILAPETFDRLRHYYEHLTLQDITSSWKSLIVQIRLLPPVAEKVVTDITINIQNKSAGTPAQQDTKSSEPIQTRCPY